MARCFLTKARWKNTCRGYPYVFSLRLDGKHLVAVRIFFHFFLGWKKPTYSGHQMFFSLSFLLSSKKIKMVVAKYFRTRVKWKYTWWPPYIFFINIIWLCFITRWTFGAIWFFSFDLKKTLKNIFDAIKWWKKSLPFFCASQVLDNMLWN